MAQHNSVSSQKMSWQAQAPEEDEVVGGLHWEVVGESSQSHTTRHDHEKSQETALRKDREKHCNSVPMGQGLATAPRQTQPSCSVQKFRATEQIISSLIALS